MKPSIISHYSFGTVDCRKWREEIFTRHSPIANELEAGFVYHAQQAGIDGNRIGNNWLRQQDELLRFGRARCSAAMYEDEIEHLAKTKARACERSFQNLIKHQDFATAANAIRKRVESEGLNWPVKIGPNDSSETIDKKIARAIARACDPLWWRQNIRKITAQQVENVLRLSGAVHRKRSPYLSDFSLARWRSTQRRHRDMLSDFVAISNEGDELALLDCIDASVSNPVNRRNELMVRMRGYEEIADALQLRGVLLTLTAPSQYHAWHHTGIINEKYNHLTPTKAQEYLCQVWSRIRSEWARNKIKTFGFRIAEPHHDGTPHFHFLLFFHLQEQIKAYKIFRKHALAVDGDEPGAAEHRCDCVFIDKNKGSATGYVAKYIAKNIDGFGFNSDEMDEEGDVFAMDGATRARAWASIWGIRQFQQIGSTSVTVWRELRKLTIPPNQCEPEKLEIARTAADKGDWHQFVDAMGGAFARRDEQLLRPLRDLSDKPGRYGDEIRRILGVVMRRIGLFIKTRTKTWEIVPTWELENIRNRDLP